MTDVSELAEIEEQNRHNIKQLAEALGLSDRNLTTGASRKEREEKAKKARLFGAGEDVEKSDDRSDAEVVAELMHQNAENLVRLAETAGVSKCDIQGEATKTELWREAWNRWET